jgi:hypothetical protein
MALSIRADGDFNMGAKVAVMSRVSDDFVAGYYTAVAQLLRKAGCANTEVTELFKEGAHQRYVARFADEGDVELFRQHGLMP